MLLLFCYVIGLFLKVQGYSVVQNLSIKKTIYQVASSYCKVNDEFEVESNVAHQPKSLSYDVKQVLNRKLLTCLAASLVGTGCLQPLAARSATTDEVTQYQDKSNKFSLAILPSWVTNTKFTASTSVQQFQTEEILFRATSFAEGSSLSVSRSNAARLLKDFEIEWWFAPLEKMTDVGAAELVARLLILQRQAEVCCIFL